MTSPEPEEKKRWPLALGLGVAAVAASVWLTLAPPEVPDSGLDFVPSAEESVRIDQLRAQITAKNTAFRDADVRDPDNAKLFTYMAATSDNPLVVHAALAAIGSAYSSRSETKAAPDDDLQRVLVRHMSSPDPKSAELAFAAARIPLMTEAPPPELIAALASLINSDLELVRRYRALETLNLLRPSLRNETARAAFSKSLERSEPAVVSLALFALSESKEPLSEARDTELLELGQRVKPLLSHENPGVRGRALQLLTEIPSLMERSELESRAITALSDPHPYVRGQALDTLAASTNPNLVRSFLPLTRDMAEARYDIEAGTNLKGEPLLLPHDIPGRRRVAEAALFALRSVRAKAVQNGTLPEEPELVLALGAEMPSEAALKTAADAAAAWAEKVFPGEGAPVHHTQKSPAEPSPVLTP